jgi:AcrR family transcriptional regulator
MRIQPSTRERLIEATAELFRYQGLTATGIKEILAAADTGFSSLYHHFPGGKDQLAAEAILTAGREYQGHVEQVWDAAGNVVDGVTGIFIGAAAVLDATDYRDACPIGTVALEVASTNEVLREATSDVFTAWTSAAVSRFIAAGIPDDSARSLASAVIALLEGGFILARTARSTQPMASAGQAAAILVESALSSGTLPT